MKQYAIKHTQTDFFINEDGVWQPFLTVGSIWTDYESVRTFFELYSLANVATIVEVEL
jgi:hypothetical protein